MLARLLSALLVRTCINSRSAVVCAGRLPCNALSRQSLLRRADSCMCSATSACTQLSTSELYVMSLKRRCQPSNEKVLAVDAATYFVPQEFDDEIHMCESFKVIVQAYDSCSKECKEHVSVVEEPATGCAPQIMLSALGHNGITGLWAVLHNP